MLSALSDDLLRVIVRFSEQLSSRVALSKTCTRLSQLVRLEEALFVQVTSAQRECADQVGFDQAQTSPDGRYMLAAIQLDVCAAETQHFPRRLSWAIETLLLTYRKSVSQVAFRRMRLHLRDDLDVVLPALLFHIAGAAASPRVRVECLSDLTLCSCLLPQNLPQMLKHVRHLRMWNCSPTEEVHSSEYSADRFWRSIADQPNLRTLIWTGEAADPIFSLPETILTAPRGPRSLDVLVLSIEQIEWYSHDAETIEIDWCAIGGPSLRELSLLGEPVESSWSQDLGTTVLSALPTWHETLRSFHLEDQELSNLVRCAGGAAPLIEALPPSLEALGTVDCSWLSPTWFFDTLARCDPPRLTQLRSLSICINSPGANSSI
jgi:hypothetical protein